MIGALGGGDSLEIVVALKDLTGSSFKKLESNLHNLGKAGTTAAGKEAKGGGGIGGLVGGLTSLAGGPSTLAITAIGTLTAAGIALTDTYDKVERQEADLDAAFRTNGETLDKNRAGLDALIDRGVAYGQGADQVRGAVLELAQAGHKWSDITATMPTVLALAQQKHLDLAQAAKMVELAEMGNMRALKDLGVEVPKVTTSEIKHYAATHHLSIAHAEAALKAQHQADVLKALNQRLGDGKPHATAMEQAQTKLGDAWERLATKIGPPLEKVFADIIDAFSGLIDFGGRVFGLVNNLWTAFTKLPAPIQFIINPIAAVAAHFGDLIGIIQHVLDMLGKVFDMAKRAGDAVANSPIGKVAGGAGDLYSHTVGGLVNNIANLIPHFASGGVVTRPTLALVGESGPEMIVPKSRFYDMGGGGHTFNVSFNSIWPPTRQQAEEIADVIERQLGARFNLRGTSAVGLGGN